MMQESIQITRLAMNMELNAQKALTEQIARYQTGGSFVAQVNFDQLLQQLAPLSATEQERVAAQIMNDWLYVAPTYQTYTFSQISLDELVAKSVLVSGQFQKLAEGLNRQLGLMSLAIQGGKR
jgi:flagellar basal-body rod protein FlgB